MLLPLITFSSGISNTCIRDQAPTATKGGLFCPEHQRQKDASDALLANIKYPLRPVKPVKLDIKA